MMRGRIIGKEELVGGGNLRLPRIMVLSDGIAES
jgi:hypothetical protein